MASKNYASPQTAKSDARIEQIRANIPQHNVATSYGRHIDMNTKNATNRKVLIIIIAIVVIIALIAILAPILFGGTSKPVAELDIDTTPDIVSSSSSSSAASSATAASTIDSEILGTWSATGISLTLKSDGTGTVTTNTATELTWTTDGNDVLLTDPEGHTQKATYYPKTNTLEVSGVELTRATSSTPVPAVVDTPAETPTSSANPGSYDVKIQINEDPNYNVKDYDGLTFDLADDGSASISKGDTVYAQGMSWTKDDAGNIVLTNVDQMKVNVPNNFIYMLKNEADSSIKLSEKDNELFMTIDDSKIVIKLYHA